MMATYEKMLLTSNFDSFLSKTCLDDKKSWVDLFTKSSFRKGLFIKNWPKICRLAITKDTEERPQF